MKIAGEIQGGVAGEPSQITLLPLLGFRNKKARIITQEGQRWEIMGTRKWGPLGLDS